MSVIFCIVELFIWGIVALFSTGLCGEIVNDSSISALVLAYIIGYIVIDIIKEIKKKVVLSIKNKNRKYIKFK